MGMENRRLVRALMTMLLFICPTASADTVRNFMRLFVSGQVPLRLSNQERGELLAVDGAFGLQFARNIKGGQWLQIRKEILNSL